MQTIKIGDKPITYSAFKKIVFNAREIDLSDAQKKVIEDSYNFLVDFASTKLVYGINTSFGPMAQYKIQKKDQTDLQYNLIRSHSSGSGNELSPHLIRAIMLVRLTALSQGKSGIHLDLIELLRDLINADACPLIFELGGVGASGDLVQLAHLGLGLIGEGEMWYKGNKKDAKDVFQSLNLSPLKIYLREGLAILNGTSTMTGIGLINLVHSRNLLHWTLLSSSMILEIVRSFDDSFSRPLNEAKQHPGQQKIASLLSKLLADSQCIQSRAFFQFSEKTENVYHEKVQEYYSLRCLPQILGPIWDTIQNCETVLINEANSSSDNPIVSSVEQNVFHGGNFHGDYVAVEMDKMKTVITKLSMLLERQLNYLLNDRLNEILPCFVNLGNLGIELGMQGTQFTATSTTAENQTLSFPMYVHSIPCNKDNQDIVSMGSNAALMARRVNENTYTILSILMITIVQAIDYLDIKDQLSTPTAKYYEQIRMVVPRFDQDMIMYKPIQELAAYLKSTLVEEDENIW